MNKPRSLKTHWNQWSLPNKLTAIGTFLGAIGIIISILFFYLDSPSNSINVSNVEGAEVIIGNGNEIKK